MGTLRNRRRVLASPSEQADAAGEQLRSVASPDQFVTGLLMRMRLADGAVEAVNAGHPAPYLVRDGAVRKLEIGAQAPLGVSAAAYRSDPFTLAPGDRLLVVTDGYLDRRAGGVEIEAVLAQTQDRHPRQIVQELAHRVLELTGGKLEDDATALCLDWYGPGAVRAATGGASRARATG